MTERSSECCGASSLGEIIDGWGMCADCKEHAEFLPHCPECDAAATYRHHVPAGNGLPETDQLVCNDCDHRWGQQ